MGAAVIEAQGLTRHYGSAVALSGLNLAIPAGEVFAMFGGNGAGKSTTMSLFLGFVTPTAGVARVAGVDVAQDPRAARRHLAYLPENVMLYPQASAIENLRYFAALAGQRLSVPEAGAALERSGLGAEAWSRPVGQMSKGMRQLCPVGFQSCNLSLNTI
jgi:ABC-2 type transport system ATP-binding protein